MLKFRIVNSFDWAKGFVYSRAFYGLLCWCRIDLKAAHALQLPLTFRLGIFSTRLHKGYYMYKLNLTLCIDFASAERGIIVGYIIGNLSSFSYIGNRQRYTLRLFITSALLTFKVNY